MDLGMAVMVQERRGEVSQTLGKKGILGECGDTIGKFRGVVTLPKATKAPPSKKALWDSDAPPLKWGVEGLQQEI